MLDYSTVQVIGSYPNFRLISVPLIILVTLAGIFVAFIIFKASNNKLGGIFVGIMFSIAFTLFLTIEGFVDEEVLVKIETTGINMSTETYSGKKDCPYLKKDGDKIYYYDLLRDRNTKTPYDIKEATEEKFQELTFNLKNSQTQEVK